MTKKYVSDDERLMKEWNFEKNSNIDPKKITIGNSREQVWWLCEHGHEWETAVYNRAKLGSNCPYCSGRLPIVGENDLATTHPNLAKEWHPTKNEKKPEDFKSGSNKVVWWLCEQGHEWDAKVSTRSTFGCNCPYCSGRLPIVGENDLATTHPYLAKEWHPTKNEKKPEDFKAGSNKEVWWLCEHGHEWKAKICNRSKGKGCPKCNKKGTSYPEQCIYYYVSKIFSEALNRHSLIIEGNVVEVDIYIPELQLAIEYDGYFFHKEKKESDLDKSRSIMKEYRLIRIREKPLSPLEDVQCFFIENVSQELGLIVYQISNFIQDNFKLSNEMRESLKALDVNLKRDNVAILELYNLAISNRSLASSYPHLVKEWHPTKNGTLSPRSFSCMSNKEVWWLCEHGHEWQTKISNRTAKNGGCPTCYRHNSGRIVAEKTDLTTIYPELAKEWHPTKNGDLTPENVSYGSNRSVWWQCELGHTWEATINNRARSGSGCPECLKESIVGKTDLVTICPHLAQQWHPTKNGDLTPQNVSYGSEKKVWWQCEYGHEWEASPNQRTKHSIKGTECPTCRKEFNLLAIVNPELAKQWHPTKNGDLTPQDVSFGSRKKVWWQCEHGYEWEAAIRDRNRTKQVSCPCNRNKNKKQPK